MIVLQRLKGIENVLEARGIDLHWNIIADGCFYSDELLVCRSIAENYLSRIKERAKQINLNASFFELDDLVKGKEINVKPFSYSDETQKPFILRTAGMINTLEYSEELNALFAERKNVACAMDVLLENVGEFRKRCELSAALYQQRKLLVEEQNMFEKYFASSVRASIQPDTGRNLLNGGIDRPLAIRITESKGKNLFPWLGVGYFDGKEWSNIYAAEAREKGLKLDVVDGLMFYQK